MTSLIDRIVNQANQITVDLINECLNQDIGLVLYVSSLIKEDNDVYYYFVKVNQSDNLTETFKQYYVNELPGCDTNQYNNILMIHKSGIATLRLSY